MSMATGAAEPAPERFAARLRALREERLLSQAELAAMIGSRQYEVSRWERGAVRPFPSTRRRIAAALGVEPAALAGD